MWLTARKENDMENLPIGIPYVIDLDDHEASGIPTTIR